MTAAAIRALALTLATLPVACRQPHPAVTATARKPDRIRIAVCQIEVDPRPGVGMQRITTALADAAAQGADLACFPEACVSGWVNPEAHHTATPIPGATTDRIAALARQHRLMVMLGLAEKAGDRLFNSVVLIDADGRLLLRHRKVNILSSLMDPPYTPGAGAADSVVETRFGRIGLLICADTFRDALVAQIAARQPDLVLVPYGWAAPADKWPAHGKSLHAWVAQTARRCGAPVVGVDSTGLLHHGPWQGHVLGGQSVVCDADGQRLLVLPDRRAAVEVREVELRRAPRQR